MAGAEREQRGMLETIIHYGNYVDGFLIAAGVVTGSVTLFLAGVAGYGGGKFVENWLHSRRMKKLAQT